MHGAGPRAKISSMKPGRNGPCPGGSGKKYKQYCLERDVPQRTDGIPDVRDGLTREERLVLYVLYETRRNAVRGTCRQRCYGGVCVSTSISVLTSFRRCSHGSAHAGEPDSVLTVTALLNPVKTMTWVLQSDHEHQRVGSGATFQRSLSQEAAPYQ